MRRTSEFDHNHPDDNDDHGSYDEDNGVYDDFDDHIDQVCNVFS